jgi:hypothetical protein
MSSTSTPELTCTGIGCNCCPNGHCGPPPPSSTYPDYNTGFEAIQARARLNGYAICTGYYGWVVGWETNDQALRSELRKVDLARYQVDLAKAFQNPTYCRAFE